MLEKYAAARMLSGEAALVGLNVDHSLLLSYAGEFLPMNEGQGLPAPKSPFLGGEVRVETEGSLSTVALGAEGSGLNNPKLAAAETVLCA
jgi:hypothetical protein